MLLRTLGSCRLPTVDPRRKRRSLFRLACPIAILRLRTWDHAARTHELTPERAGGATKKITTNTNKSQITTVAPCRV
ncbi:hypothetical protein ZHAS_00020693 [Anopheles sinensis]|uniref:Uncharacterized protein n=1 Tax=Anopheles sinensis TaxID=74873 RepID=A0A084WQF4_ANOSI|nr:hypothetical protein ZHAS_00020693 [Anopheles sinensis]